MNKEDLTETMEEVFDGDEGDNILTLTDEDGKEENFYCIAELDYEDKLYTFLQPVEASEDFDDDEVLIMEIVEGEDGEEMVLPVQDEALLSKLIDELNKMAAEADED